MEHVEKDVDRRELDAWEARYTWMFEEQQPVS
jgi:hypothetical protein